MDVNVTYPIVASVTLVQPWWIPLLNASSGLVGALIGASAALYASYIARASEERRYLRDRRIKMLQERSRVFSKSLTSITTMSVAPNIVDPNDLAKLIFINDRIIDNVFSEFAKIKGNLPSKWNSEDYIKLATNLIPVMRKRLDEINDEIDELQKPQKIHIWPFKKD